jgi:Uma2 family endonuclease
MTSTVIEKKKNTCEDYLKTSDDQRYELIEGDLLMTPSPVTKHQRILGNLYFEIKLSLRDKELGELFVAPFDVHLDNENVVQPDILFISKERLNIIGEKNIQGAPDLVIEVLSESSAYRDLLQKKKLYAKFGVKEYWIAIPEEESIEMYILKDDKYALHKTCSRNETLEAPSLKDLKIELKNIF